MDITNIPQNLIKALEQKNTEQLAVLSRVLNLVLGKTVMASVASTEPVTATEREELLKQTTAALTLLNQQAVNKLTPALKTEITRLLQQQNLIQSPELKWINLVVNNRPLLTYSDKPLVTGQTVPVQLQGPQKLVLLDSPEIDLNNLTPNKSQPAPTLPTTPLSTTLLPTTKATATSLSNPLGAIQLTETKSAIAVNELLKSAISELTNKAVTTPTNTTKISTAPAADFIGKNTAEAPESTSNKSTQEKVILPSTFTTAIDTSNKPIQQNKLNLYSANDLPLKLSTQTESKHNSPETTATKSIISEQLRNVLPHRDTPNVLLSAVMQLQNLPAATKNQLFSPSLEQALKSLAEKIRSPEQLAQPKVLAQTLKSSGVFFENKLNHLLPKENPETHNTSSKANNAYSQDLKGSLLTLLNRVTQELNGSNKPISTEQTLKLFQNLNNATTFTQTLGAPQTLNNKNDIAQALGDLIQELLHKPVKELSNKELRTQLLVLLQQHSVHSLAKIQLQQLHTLNHDVESKDSASKNTSWQLEIPVKNHHDVQHIHIRIDREWVDDKNENKPEKSSNKMRQWSVTLRFDLPTLGEFCAQLAIVNTQVSATLWAAREKTFTEVREHIEGLRKQLESEGINVKYLQCMRGMPPQKPMVLSYSLIDIST